MLLPAAELKRENQLRRIINVHHGTRKVPPRYAHG